MRKLLLTLVAGSVVAACGRKASPSSEASAAEVPTTPPVTSSVATKPVPTVTGPVSFDAAQTAFTEKRYADAVRLFTSYTSDKPDNVWGYYMLGLSTWKAGDRDAAVNAFTLALEKDASHVKSHINLSRVLIEQGRARDALPHVEAALAIDSTSGETVRLLGRVKRELGDSAGAITAYKRAIVLDERDVWSMNNLAKLYIGQRRKANSPSARAPPTIRSSRSTNTRAAYASSGATRSATTPSLTPRHTTMAVASPAHVRGKSSMAASTLMLASASSSPFAIP